MWSPPSNFGSARSEDNDKRRKTRSRVVWNPSRRNSPPSVYYTALDHTPPRGPMSSRPTRHHRSASLAKVQSTRSLVSSQSEHATARKGQPGEVQDQRKREAQDTATRPAALPFRTTTDDLRPKYPSNLCVVMLLVTVFAFTLVLAGFVVSSVRQQQYLRQQRTKVLTTVPTPMPRVHVDVSSNASEVTSRSSDVTSGDVSDIEITPTVTTLKDEELEDGGDTQVEE